MSEIKDFGMQDAEYKRVVYLERTLFMGRRNRDITIWFVDSDEHICSSVKAFCSNKFHVETFTMVQECLTRLSSASRGILILDCTLLDEPCLETLYDICRMSRTLLVIATGANITISRVVELMKQGLYDFIPKPIKLSELLNSILIAVNSNKIGFRLTFNEEKVLALLLRGMTNKEVARLLNRSVRTIEEHRLHISKKLGAENRIELIKLGHDYLSFKSGKSDRSSTIDTNPHPGSESLTG